MRKFLLPTVILPRHSGIKMHEAFLGAPGVAYDFTASAGLTQDRSGLTPVSAAAQSIGLAHDYSRAASGWVTQVDSLANPGSPFTVTTAWTGSNAALSVSFGALRITNSTGSSVSARAFTAASISANRTIRVSGTVATNIAGGINIGLNNAGDSSVIQSIGTVTATGNFSFVYTTTAPANTLVVRTPGNVADGSFYELSSISAREITGNPLIAPTDARRGTWSTMPNGLPCLSLNGTSHAYATAAAVNPGANDEVHVWAALRALANATQPIVESGPAPGIDGTWGLLRVGGSGAYFAVSRGNQTLSGSSALCPAPNAAFLYQRSKISTPTLTLARNGITELTNTATQGTGNYTSQILNIGARNAASPSLFFNGQIARLAVLYGPITTQQKTTIDGLVMQGFQTS